jgi:hypothetical protein
MMMDASLRRSVCLLGSVLAVLLLLAWPCYAQSPSLPPINAAVYFVPPVPVRGYPLDVVVNVKDQPAGCNLILNATEVFFDAHETKWEFTNQTVRSSIEKISHPTRPVFSSAHAAGTAAAAAH